MERAGKAEVVTLSPENRGLEETFRWLRTAARSWGHQGFRWDCEEMTPPEAWGPLTHMEAKHICMHKIKMNKSLKTWIISWMFADVKRVWFTGFLCWVWPLKAPQAVINTNPMLPEVEWWRSSLDDKTKQKPVGLEPAGEGYRDPASHALAAFSQLRDHSE